MQGWPDRYRLVRHGTDTDGRKDKRRESFGHGALKLCGEAGTGHGQGHGNSSQILVSSTSAVQIAKESVIALREVPLEQAFETEAMLGYKAFTGEDAKEGLDAFYNKRKPEFPSKKW